MAVKFLHNLNLNQLEIQNARIQNLGSDPAQGVSGQVYYNTTVNKMRLHNGSSWIDIAGDITDVIAGLGLTGGGTAGSVTLNVNPDNTTLQIVGDTVAAKTAAVVNGGTALATGDQIYDFVIGQGYSTTVGTVTSVTVTGSNGLAGTGTVTSSGTITLTNADKGSDQAIFKTLTFGASSINAEVNNETVLFSGQNGITYNVVGKSVEISLDSVPNAALANSSVTYTAGSGLTGGGSVALGASATLNVGAGDGISVSADAVAVDATVVRTSGEQTIAGIKTFSNDVIVNGDLYVNGTTTTVNTETIALADNIITINSNAVAAVENGGMEVFRGAGEFKPSVLWVEGEQRWEITNDGTTYHRIPIAGEYNNLTYNISAVDSTATSKKIRLSDGVTNDDVTIAVAGSLAIARSGDTITLTATDTNTQRTDEEIRDVAGTQVAAGANIGVSVSYDDANNRVNFINSYNVQSQILPLGQSTYDVDLGVAFPAVINVYDNSTGDQVITEISQNPATNQVTVRFAGATTTDYVVVASGVRA